MANLAWPAECSGAVPDAKRHARLSFGAAAPALGCSPRLPTPPRTGAVLSVASRENNLSVVEMIRLLPPGIAL
jgi:hypothetical protein